MESTDVIGMKELTIHHVPGTEAQAPRVRVCYRSEVGSQPQERESEFSFTINQNDQRLIQWYLEEYLIYPWGEFRNRAQQVEKLMGELGVQLFEAVFNNRQLAALYAHVADDLPNTRIVIHAGADNPDGIALPWELLRDPTRSEYGWLAGLAYTFVRSQPDLVFDPPAQPTAVGTFNILMVICRPSGSDDVAFQSVARPLLELFREHRDRIRLDVLRPATFERLSRVLHERPDFYHVLHFDGHGMFPERGGQGLLSFEAEDGGSRSVTGEELGRLLAGKGVPVVLLNACQSGMTHPESLFPSVGNQLLKAGTRGVVAMAYSVYVQTAVRFMTRLYQGLINGEELARALTLARADLRDHQQRLSPIGQIELRDWIVPILFEAAPTSLVPEPVSKVRLDLGALQNKQAQAGAEIDCPQPPAFGFVGRDNVVLDLERAYQTETVVLLEGMAGIGKTEMAIGFARWWKETGALDEPLSRIFFFRFEHYLSLAGICDRIGYVCNALVRQQLKTDWHLLNPDERREIALALLKQTPSLLIFDNFEPVAGFPTGAPSDWKPEEQKEIRDLLGALRGGRTKVLITSRRDEPWLGPIYKKVVAAGLKLHEAQELAVRVLERAGLSSHQLKSLPEYNRLLEFLQGNPLAIQVILPALKRTAPDALLEALQTGTAKLTHDDPAQGRERSLTASLNYRLDKLDPTVRQRLAVLGLFQGFVDVAVLADLCEAPVPFSVEGADRARLEANSRIGGRRGSDELHRRRPLLDSSRAAVVFLRLDACGVRRPVGWA